MVRSLRVVRLVLAALPLTLLLSSIAHAHTSIADGDWSSTSTWDAGTVPGNGDTVVIGHHVTVTTSAIAGSSPASSGTPAITVQSGGSLTVTADQSLTVRGDIKLANSVLNMAEGSAIYLDASLASSPSSTHYFIRVGTGHNQSSRLNITGTSTNRCTIESITTNGAGHGAITDDEFLQGGQVDAAYADFVNIGDSTIPAIQTAVTGSASFSLENVVFDGGGLLQTTYGIGDSTIFSLSNVTFKNTLASQSAVIYAPNSLASGTREIVQSIFDKEVQLYPPTDISFDRNLFLGAFDVTDGEWALFDHNVVKLDGYARNLPGGTSNNFWLVTGAATYNPNFVEVGTYDRSTLHDGEIFQVDGEAEEGDCFAIGEPTTAVTVTIKNSIVLPASLGESSGTLFSALGNANVTLVAEHNTYMAGTQGAAVGLAYAGHGGMISSFKSNLAWDTSARGYKLFDSGTNDNVSDLVSSAAADYNGGHNLLTGSNGAGYDGLEFSSGSPGANDVTDDPDFVDESRNIATWDASLGGPGTAANALAELAKRNDAAGYNPDYNIADLIAYIREGFAPRNTAYQGTAHDSEDIGAVPVFTETEGGGGAMYGAPPVDLSHSLDFLEAISFIFEGDDPVQTGVSPGTISEKRAAVIRGRVLDTGSNPLAGVTVKILGRSELGQATTRNDGSYDMAVNGGGEIVVVFSKSGYLPVQRRTAARWREWSSIPDVVLTELDTNMTSVTLSSMTTPEVVQGSTVSDGDGSRQGTLIVFPGTTATITDSMGTSSIDTLSLRITEYTVGPDGEKAMPGPLPAASAYTYAIELSADEALSADRVDFSSPLSYYVDNFLGFPVGADVPVGYYDRGLSAWVPMENGVVVKILSISGGSAVLDVTGSGTPSSGGELTAHGITSPELLVLGSLYSAGTELWRVRIDHFTPIDLNWPLGPLNFPLGAVPPALPKLIEPIIDNPRCSRGSIIECENQVLGETIPIVGTEMALTYSSERATGRKTSKKVKIRLTESSVPPAIIGVVLEVKVAGQSHVYSFPPDEDLSYEFEWDGKDVYGREVSGSQTVWIRVGYVYEGVYGEPNLDSRGAEARAFGLPGNGSFSPAIPARNPLTHYLDYAIHLTNWHPEKTLPGGWSLTPHHSYDSIAKKIYFGDGSRRTTASLGEVLKTVAGGAPGFPYHFGGDNGPATAAAMNKPRGLAVAADGTMYISDSGSNRIRKVAPDGIITTIAGTGTAGFSGDDGPATSANLNEPWGLALATDGTLYICDRFNYRIRKISPAGIISTVAGTGVSGFLGDGGPATSARITHCTDVELGPDGSLYIGDLGNGRVRLVTPDGIISTVVGQTSTWPTNDGDGGFATSARTLPSGISIGPDGSIFIADLYHKIRKVTPDGIITSIAGTGTPGFYGDGEPAASAAVQGPSFVLAAPDGNIYISDDSNYRIRKIDQAGIITTIAGNGSGGGGVENSAALLSAIDRPQELAMTPEGQLLVADLQNYRIKRLGSPLPGYDASGYQVASEDGSELYVFDENGRHLSTKDTLLGIDKYTFSYDLAGRLIEIADVDNDVTEITYDGNALSSITSPFGVTTTLSTDNDGYLATIENPAGNAYSFTYAAGGLLATMTDPENHTYTFTYDENGRLEEDEDPVNGSQTLARTESADGFTVTRTTSLNRVTSYEVEKLGNGGLRVETTHPDGRMEERVEGVDRVFTSTDSSGMTTERAETADSRFGLISPISGSYEIGTPGSLLLSIDRTRTVTLSDLLDPLSVTSLVETTSINGNSYTSTYTASTKTTVTESPEGRETTMVVNAEGRLSQISITGINATNFTYDAHGRIEEVSSGSGPDERSTTFAYDTQGFLESVTNPLSQVTQYGYDLAGRVNNIVLPDLREINLTYDASGNLASLTTPANDVHSFSYTGLNQEELYEAPAVSGGGTNETAYVYNLDRQLTSVTRPDNQSITYSYDSTSGRLTGITLPTGSMSYTYDSTTKNLSEISGPYGQTLAFGYDGSLLTSESISGDINGSVEFGHDNDFRLSTLSVNSTDSVSIGYDDDGLVTSVGDLTITRDAGNGRITATSITSGMNSVTDTRSYNAFGELSEYEAKYNSTVLLYQSFTRDKLGRIIEKEETIGGITDTYGYIYDDAGRLTEVTLNSVTLSTYTFDDNGNRTDFDGIPATYDAQDRILTWGSDTFSHTANGELASKTSGLDTTSYSYDAFGSLLSVTLPNSDEIDYLVDPKGRRVGKKVNSTLIRGFLYMDDLKPIVELDGNGDVVSRFVYGTTSLVPDYMHKSGTTYRIVSDRLGSVRLVVNVSTGAIAQRIDYNELGNVIQNTSPGFQPFGFAGGLYDSDTGLVRFGAREYHAKIGRWTDKDPIRFAGGDINLYGYVLNDPINRLDPSGFADLTNNSDLPIVVKPEDSQPFQPPSVCMPGETCLVDGVYPSNPRKPIVKIPDNCSGIVDVTGTLTVDCNFLERLDRLAQCFRRTTKPRVVLPKDLLQDGSEHGWPDPYSGENWPYDRFPSE